MYLILIPGKPNELYHVRKAEFEMSLLIHPKGWKFENTLEDDPEYSAWNPYKYSVNESNEVGFHGIDLGAPISNLLGMNNLNSNLKKLKKLFKLHNDITVEFHDGIITVTGSVNESWTA